VNRRKTDQTERLDKSVLEEGFKVLDYVFFFDHCTLYNGRQGCLQEATIAEDGAARRHERTLDKRFRIEVVSTTSRGDHADSNAWLLLIPWRPRDGHNRRLLAPNRNKITVNCPASNFTPLTDVKDVTRLP
jgi:hypothetical protein